MGGGNGQKSKMAREKNMEKQRAAGKGSQLESNKKAMSIQSVILLTMDTVGGYRSHRLRIAVLLGYNTCHCRLLDVVMFSYSIVKRDECNSDERKSFFGFVAVDCSARYACRRSFAPHLR
ncbi:hypothetical protein WN943_007987 [Citrus x changshan-huyou]